MSGRRQQVLSHMDYFGYAFEHIRHYNGDQCWVIRRDGKRIDAALSEASAKIRAFHHHVAGKVERFATGPDTNRG